MRNNKASSKNNRGGKRENAGRKPIWNNPDTCTIRVPKIYAQKVMQLAHQLDSGEEFDNDTKSNSVIQAIDTNIQPELKTKEIMTESLLINQLHEDIDNITKSISPELAISMAKKILRHKKSARISIAKLISKLYNQNISPDSLK
ncbi:hypothetical protein F7734_10690 [Scytonema sp. UIC 10036]|uniref:hypothetical protein n=1 Tax=Scytonema sp. UIC 10036 TaxID=2304196 RepID=UPI0012DACF99|nr:hypothetical protein [Scytonema sp. UIC 10036]MUG92890.1 hypothetical protein [Scytonema sp. UIC 10036]